MFITPFEGPLDILNVFFETLGEKLTINREIQLSIIYFSPHFLLFAVFNMYFQFWSFDQKCSNQNIHRISRCFERAITQANRTVIAKKYFSSEKLVKTVI